MPSRVSRYPNPRIELCTNLKAGRGTDKSIHLRVWSPWQRFLGLVDGELERTCMVSSDEGRLRGFHLPLDMGLVPTVLGRKGLPFLVWVTAFWGSLGILFELHAEPFAVTEITAITLPTCHLAKCRGARCVGVTC